MAAQPLNGEEDWADITGATEGTLRVKNESGAMLYAYRCVVQIGESSLPSDEIRLASEALTKWIAGGATEEMYRRAMSSPSLESMVLEGDELIYVRTGRALAHYDEKHGMLVDDATGKPVAALDEETGMVYPLNGEE